MKRNFVLDTTNFSTNLVLNEPRETRISGDSQLKCAVCLRSTLACPRLRRQSKPPYYCSENALHVSILECVCRFKGKLYQVDRTEEKVSHGMDRGREQREKWTGIEKVRWGGGVKNRQKCVEILYG